MKLKDKLGNWKRKRETQAQGLMPCPDCGGRMRSGPQAGLSVNLKCESCEEMWNYTYPPFDCIERISGMSNKEEEK
jgi:tRNA(Ile2) C34 agmatinyltransferase TiaS